MSSVLGNGALASGQPPAQSSILQLWDPAHGIASSGGFVDSWTALRGGGVISAAGAARPAVGVGCVTFDGVDDALTAAALATSGLAGATLAYWLRQNSPLAAQNPIITADFPTGFLSRSNATFVDGFSGGAVTARATIPVTADAWTFVAQTFDGSLALGQKTKIWMGNSPAAIVNRTSFDDTAIAAFPAAVGTFRVGGFTAAWLTGSIALLAVYTAPLTLAQLQQLAAYRVPSA